MRVREMQASPLFMIAFGIMSGSASSRLTSSSSTAADLPPSSRLNRVEVLATGGRDLAARRSRPGERDLVDVGAVHQIVADLPSCRDHAQHSLWQAGIGEHLGEHEGVERCLRRGLEHDRAAREQRGCELGAGEEEGHVPRCDRRDDAHRLLGDDDRSEKSVLHLLERIGRPEARVVVEDHGRARRPVPSLPTTPATRSRSRSAS